MGCPLVGLGRVCAQPKLDQITSGEGDQDPLPTVKGIRSNGSSLIRCRVGVDQSRVCGRGVDSAKSGRDFIGSG